MTAATDKARDLGTEHGTRAAEEWVAIAAGWRGGDSVTYYAILRAYSAAFTAAVEATIRSAVES